MKYIYVCAYVCLFILNKIVNDSYLLTYKTQYDIFHIYEFIVHASLPFGTHKPFWIDPDGCNQMLLRRKLHWTRGYDNRLRTIKGKDQKIWPQRVFLIVCFINVLISQTVERKFHGLIQLYDHP